MSHEKPSVQGKTPLEKISLEMIMIVLAAVGAVVIGKYPEAGGVILLYLCVKLLEKQAVKKSREKIAASAVLSVKNGWTYEEAVSQETRTERLIRRFSGMPAPSRRSRRAAGSSRPCGRFTAAPAWRTTWIRTGSSGILRRSP